MEGMKYVDILKNLPKETQKRLLDKRFYFAEKTGIDGILGESQEKNIV